MLSNKSLLGLFALSAIARAQIPSNKPLAFPTGLDVLDTASGGLNNLPHPTYTSKKWAWGTLPKYCYDVAQAQDWNCKATDVEVYDVTYSDVSHRLPANRPRILR